MASRSRTRKALLWTAGLMLLLVAIVLASPLWLPWMLKPIAHRYGADFKTSERLGYSGLALENVTFTNSKVTLRAERVQTLQPISWLWRHIIATDRASDFVSVRDWELILIPQKPADKPVTRKPTSVYSIVEKIDQLAPKVEAWIPAATLTNGVVRFGTNEVRVAQAIWKGGVLNGNVSVAPRTERASYELDLSRRNNPMIRAAVPAFATQTRLRAMLDAGKLHVTGEVFWQTNSATVTAEFDREGTLPTVALVEAPALRIPADTIRLTNYHDVTASLSANWNGTNFSIDLAAAAEPTRNSLPYLHVALRAHGTTNAVRVENFSFTSPWGKADLSKDVDVSFKGKLLSDVAELKIESDLSQQQFFAATGFVSGQLFLRRSERRFPDATFKVRAREVSVAKFKLQKTEADGTFAWPDVHMDRLFAHFAEGATATAHGGINLQRKVISGGVVDIVGMVPPAFLPTNVALGKITLSAQVDGPITNLSHEGRVEVHELKASPFNPLHIRSEWSGVQTDIKTFVTSISASNAILRLSGAAAMTTNRMALTLQELTLSTNKTKALTLQQPTTIIFERGGTSAWHAVVSPFRWRGAGGQMTIAATTKWPMSGTIAVTADQLRTGLFQDFLKRPLPEVAISELRLSAGWTNAPITFSLTGFANYNLPDVMPLKIRINAVGNKNGVRFDDLDVSSETQTLVAAHGVLPLRIDPSHPKNIVKLEVDAPIDFYAVTKASDPFWNRFTNITRIKLEHPTITVDVSGTLNKPTGQMSARVTKAQWLGASRRLPEVTELRAEISADRQTLHLQKLNFKVEGQPVFVEAEMPIGDFARDWKKMFDWHKATGRVVVEQAHVAPFIPFAPAVLGPSGTIDLNVTVTPGPKLNGDFRVRDAETRPLGTIGTLHDLRAELKFTESLVQFTNVTGILGGEHVGLSGFINFAQTAPNKLPLFDLNVAGRAVPLTRKPDLILRADFELNALNTRTNDQPVVSGLVSFNESFFLGDLKMLLPGKVTKPRERPPYFSVEAEPFAKWKVNVRMVGENFLKVRTPLFRGSISANLRVRGTLREPIALGDAKIESGQVQFPFANLRIQQGFVSLTSEDPYRPHLFANASSRTFGYDVQMTLNGPADKPVIEFSSTPPLTSEQVLLMMTAGELPKRETTFSTEQRAGRLALFLGKSLLSKFTGDDGGAERLTITSGENVTEQGKQTYAIEYKINDDVSIVGEYDRFGAWNAGVKWRVYSR